MLRSACKAILSKAVLTGGEALGMSAPIGCLEPTVTDQREETMKLMSTADNRQCANNGSTSPLVKNMLRSDWRLVFNCFEKPEKVYFLFIALKRMETFERRWCQTYGLGVKSLLL